LEVAGAACNDSLSLSAAAVVAQLTGLRSLVWDDSPEQLSGLQLLTALQRLTELKLPQWQRFGKPVILQDKVGVDGNKAPAALHAGLYLFCRGYARSAALGLGRC
jgi:hypothetical protein